jgi:hypothetical protein
MVQNSELIKYFDLRNKIGGALLNSLFPNEFEYYLISLELVDSDDKSVLLFIFPITPADLQESYSPITNIKKTLGGVTILKNHTFIPREISIRGSFGRELKLLIGDVSFSANAFVFQNSINEVDINKFSARVKTGYGCIKILEKIIYQSQQMDSKGNPYKLYFYNPIFGNSYIVEVVSFSQQQSSQNQQMNMIPNYNLNLKGIMPLDGIIDQTDESKSLKSHLSFSLINLGLSQFVGNIKKIIEK